ncbi:MAG TPA: peptidase S41, partial [Rhodopila sp.]|nr:peptidase S41 [Rhodopila sp.]
MIRLGLLLALVVIARVHAEGAPGAGLDRARLTAVYQESLTFVAPRTLEPVPIPELTFWGLQSLSALDPALRVVLWEKRLRLFRQEQLLAELAVPVSDTAAEWARMTTELTAAAFDASALLRQAGTQGLIEEFFDQMFSRLDPYSRYVPPQEAGKDRENRAGKAGLGLAVGLHGKQIEVRSVARESPAAIAGIHPGDILVFVDG